MAKFVNLVWREANTPTELHDMLYALGEEYCVSPEGRGLTLDFKKVPAADSRVNVIRERGRVTIEYSSLTAAARGVGAALAGLDGVEATSFETLGVMIDMSRAMVSKVDHLKTWLRRLALSGCNFVMLYCEDVYQLEGEPFFGYMRGAYSIEEIRELDAYAQELGIELCGCIEVLGHLEQIMRWRNYDRVSDTASVIMVDSPEALALIEKMVDFWDQALGSRRLHIGMDEAWDLGRGRYTNQHGAADEFELFNRHLAAVNAICRKHDLQPIIWSDMYFRLASPERLYYVLDTKIPEKVRRAIPENIKLVYWDYYNEDPAVYTKMIELHRQLGFEPMVGSGLQTWRRLWHDFDQTRHITAPCIAAARQAKVKELFFCLWGDDNAPCDLDSALAGLFFATDRAWGVEDDRRTAKRFEACCFSSYAAQLIAGSLDLDLAGRKITGPVTSADCRLCDRLNDMVIAWDDPLLGIAWNNYRLIDPDFAERAIAHYEEIIDKLQPYLDDCAAGDIAHAINIAKYLAFKLELRSELVDAYADDNRAALREIATTLVPATLAALHEFDESLRSRWLACAKPFGLEGLQIRNAGVAARIAETGRRIRDYLDGAIDRIDELEVEPPPAGTPPDFINSYKQLRSGYWEK